jgi:hypothetical protein
LIDLDPNISSAAGKCTAFPLTVCEIREYWAGMVALPIGPQELHCTTSCHDSCCADWHVIFPVAADVTGDRIGGEEAVGDWAVVFEEASDFVDWRTLLGIFVWVPGVDEVAAE